MNMIINESANLDNFKMVKSILDSSKFSIVTYKFTDQNYSIFCYAEKQKLTKIEISEHKELIVNVGDNIQILIDLLDPKLTVTTKADSLYFINKNSKVFIM